MEMIHPLGCMHLLSKFHVNLLIGMYGKCQNSLLTFDVSRLISIFLPYTIANTQLINHPLNL